MTGEGGFDLPVLPGVSALPLILAEGVVKLLLADGQNDIFTIATDTAKSIVGASGHNGDEVTVSFEEGKQSPGAISGTPDTGWILKPNGDGSVFSACIKGISGNPAGLIMIDGGLSPNDVLTSGFDALCRQIEAAMAALELSEAKIRKHSEEVFRLLVEHSYDQFSLIGRDLTIRSLSPSVEKLVFNRPDPIIGKSIGDFIHPDDMQDFIDAVDGIIQLGNGSSTKIEYRVKFDDDTWRVIDTALTNLLDEPYIGAIALNSRDISARRSLEIELQHRELFDPLTGLPNRSLLLERAALALTRATRRGGDIAMVLVDFDDFQLVNDSFGHSAGDGVLKAAGIMLETIVRLDDTIAHIGGDEFAILVCGGEMPRSAELVAERVFKVLEEAIPVGTAMYNVRASVGISVGGAGLTAEELLRNADLAVSSAKKSGKGCIEIFRDEMHDEVAKKLHTASDLKRAIEDGEIEPFYQPIVNVATAQVIGAEALARWRHPDRGLVQPFEFIPLAEATGLVVPMGVEILRKSCQQRKEWGDAGLVDSSFYVSVNVSPVQLQRDDVVEVISEVINSSGVDPKAIVLEITETCAMQRIEEMMERLEALKTLGLRMALDDFGTGYSSLSYLSRLPMDIVKIDKSFVDRITGGNEGLKIVKTMVDLGASLDLTTLAEGVEEEDQLEALNSLGCTTYQGYFFAKPMPIDEFVTVLESQRKNAVSAMSASTN